MGSMAWYHGRSHCPIVSASYNIMSVSLESLILVVGSLAIHHACNYRWWDIERLHCRNVFVDNFDYSRSRQNTSCQYRGWWTGQSSILSPYLFNVHVDDLSVALNACQVGCCVVNVINHIMYADDLVILAAPVAGLSKLLSICWIFWESNYIIFNQKKSASLYFISKMLKGAHLPNVYLNGVLVKQVNSVKYIGHFLTCKLSDDIDIRRQCRVLKVRGNILFSKFHMRSAPVKLKLFNSYCSSLYTPHLWWNYKKMSVTKLQITYHNILKRNIGLSKYESTSATCNDIIFNQKKMI